MFSIYSYKLVIKVHLVFINDIKMLLVKCAILFLLYSFYLFISFKNKFTENIAEISKHVMTMSIVSDFRL